MLNMEDGSPKEVNFGKEMKEMEEMEGKEGPNGKLPKVMKSSLVASPTSSP
jgi:hypothetical protein